MQHKAIRWIGKKTYKDVVLLKWSLGGVKDSIKDKLIYEADSWKIPMFPVNGNDIQNLGIAQGKHIGEVLFKAENWWENNNYKPLKAEILDYILAGRDKL
jgi:poly(A) polymerase